jgi:hypothetical protein
VPSVEHVNLQVSDSLFHKQSVGFFESTINLGFRLYGFITSCEAYYCLQVIHTSQSMKSKLDPLGLTFIDLVFPEELGHPLIPAQAMSLAQLLSHSPKGTADHKNEKHDPTDRKRAWTFLLIMSEMMRHCQKMIP